MLVAGVLMFRASFFAAPHRVMFLGGSIQALLAMGFWSLQTGGHYAGFWSVPVWPLLAVLPQSLWHGLLMGSGVFPWFVFGFILTAGPRWQGAADLGQRDFLPPFMLLAVGWLLVWIALFVPALLAIGLAVVLAGWMLVARILTRIALRPALGREHIVCVALAAWLGAAGIGAYIVLALSGDIAWGRLGISLSLWGFLLPVFVTVSHRMLPFFTSAVQRGYVVQRPAWALRTLLGAGILHGALSQMDLSGWLWAADLPAMLAAGTLSWLWWQRGVLENRMVAVLHIAFGWLAPAFALFALQSALPGAFGQAPLHALAIGFFSSMMIGMVSRVTLGHSGRPVLADGAMWTAFCLMQVAALLRVAGELPLPGGPLAVVWLSSAVWLGAFLVWAAGYAPALWRRRADGKPG